MDINGNVMNFTWNGPSELGTIAGYSNKTLTLGGGDYELRAWHGGVMTMEYLADGVEGTKEEWTATTAKTCTLPENGYYNVEQVGNCIVATYEVIDNTTSSHGIVRSLYDADQGAIYNFIYLENADVYNAERAMKVIESIEFWDYKETN